MESKNIKDTESTNASDGMLALESVIADVEVLCRSGQPKVAIKTYKSWIKSSDSHDKFIAQFNLGVLLVEQGDLKAARASYRACLKSYPGFAQAHINLGWVLEKLEQPDLAIQQWLCVATNPKAEIGLQITALNHLGRVQEAQKNYQAAEAFLSQSLLRNPDQPDVRQHWLFLRMKQCAWPALQAAPRSNLHATVRDASPLASLALFDEPALQYLSAHSLVQRKYIPLAKINSSTHNNSNSRIRIAYFSGDLCTHAVGLLLPEIIEAHDKTKFEVIAFDYSPEDGSVCRERLKRAFEYWIDLKGQSDAEVIACIQKFEVDVLIDLHGLSAGGRPGVMAQRPARFQGVYLGFMGTTSMPWVDFVVTDRYAWPKDGAMYYNEAPVFVEPCLFPISSKDAKHFINDPAQFTRTQEGLPARAFVLACFNHVYKINPEIWSAWMYLLKQVKNSVLWLLDDNSQATQNLRTAALARGIEPHRIIFSPRTGYYDYRHRLQLVDLYLDTFPYNAGSTARDVVESGVPLLTRSGHTMVSRMAGSLLHAVGLSELVVTSNKAYRKKALELMTDRAQTRRLRKKLQRQLVTQPSTANKIVATLEEQITQRLLLLQQAA